MAYLFGRVYVVEFQLFFGAAFAALTSEQLNILFTSSCYP